MLTASITSLARLEAKIDLLERSNDDSIGAEPPLLTNLRILNHIVIRPEDLWSTISVPNPTHARCPICLNFVSVRGLASNWTMQHALRDRCRVSMSARAAAVDRVTRRSACSLVGALTSRKPKSMGRSLPLPSRERRSTSPPPWSSRVMKPGPSFCPCWNLILFQVLPRPMVQITLRTS